MPVLGSSPWERGESFFGGCCEVLDCSGKSTERCDCCTRAVCSKHFKKPVCSVCLEARVEARARRKFRRNSMQKESSLQSKLIGLCKAQGWDAMKHSPTGRNGEPDVLVLIPGGHAAFVEMKKPGEEPSKLQEHRLNELKRRGFIAGWADNPLVAFDRIVAECKKRRIRL